MIGVALPVHSIDLFHSFIDIHTVVSVLFTAAMLSHWTVSRVAGYKASMRRWSANFDKVDVIPVTAVLLLLLLHYIQRQNYDGVCQA